MPLEEQMIWFKCYTAWDDIVDELSDAEAGRFFKALMKYHKAGEIRALSGTEKLMYNIALKQAKQDEEHVAEISRIRSEARRGKRQNQNKSNDNNSYQMLSNDNNSYQIQSNDNNSQQELRVKNKELREEEFKNIANAKELETSNPDTFDFWKFAKENAELAFEFHKETGLTPIKSQFGRWVNDLRDLTEAEISIDRMKKTVAYMRMKDIPISAPGSLLKTAQWLKTRGSVPIQQQSKQKPAYNSFEELAMEMNGIPVPVYDVEIGS